MIQVWQDFSLLRPWVLLGALPLAVIVWALHKNSDPSHQFQGLIAPHLLQHLIIRPEHKNRLRPSHLLLPMGLVMLVALAGPSWRRIPAPFAKDQAGIMILLKVGPTMEATDLPPSRLERARHKIRDLLALRAGEPAGLIAYSGSAHLVMPLTHDTGIIEKMAQALAPSVMPAHGDALEDAMALAQRQFEGRQTADSILVITDTVDLSALGKDSAAARKPVLPVQFLAVAADRPAYDRSGIQGAARILDASVQILSVDETDVRRLAHRAAQPPPVATAGTGGDRRQDEGYLLLPFLALGVLLYARKGWSIQWKRGT